MNILDYSYELLFFLPLAIVLAFLIRDKIIKPIREKQKKQDH